MASRKIPGLHWSLSLLFSLLSLVCVLIILLSGIGDHVPADYLKVDTTNLNAPATLGNSAFLQDLTTISGSDLVGQDASSETLGLSKFYSLTLLTACAENDSSTSCGAPRIGFNFNPGSDLGLDGTSLQGTFSSAYSDQLQTYGKVSMFVGVAYVLAILLTALSCLVLVLSRCLPRTVIVSKVAAGLVTVILFVAAIASVVTFVKLRDAFNSALGGAGLQTEVTSRAIGLSFGAAAFSLAALLMMLTEPRAQRTQVYPAGARGPGDTADGLDGKHGNTSFAVAGGNQQRSQPAPGFLSRLPTWNRHKYAQVEKQGAAVRSRSAASDDDRRRLVAPADDFPHEYLNDFAMGPVKKHAQDPNDLYDPTSMAYKPHTTTNYAPHAL